MGKQIFDTAGVDTFEVPIKVTSLTIKMWGAGAGGAAGGTASVGGAGGGGGYVQATIAVTPSETLNVHVGGAGGLGTFGGTYSGGGGGGGGKSSVYRSVTPLLVAGSGGGGGGGDNSSATAGGAGGAGGGSTGGSGGNSSSAIGAGGGTQSISGTAGTGGANIGIHGRAPASTTLNNALNFDGDPEYVEIGNDSVFNFTSSFTLECWIKPDSVSAGAQRVISSRSADTNNGVGFGIQNANIAFTAYSKQDYNSSGTVSVGVWTHIAVVFTSGYDARFYKNGVFVDQINGSLAATTTGINMILAQLNDDTQFFAGEIDEVRMWNDVRTDKEISDYYAQTLTGSEANLVAYYKCNESSGSNLPDETSNENDGTLQDMEDADWVTSDWSPLDEASDAGAGGDGGDGTNSGTSKGGEANGGTTYGGSGGEADLVGGFGGGGGGGAGYAGGGGGSCSASTDAGGSGGGGGSNYIVGTATSITNSQASGQTPPNTGDPDYTGSVGIGGDGGATSTNGNDGNDGLIVILWEDPPVHLGMLFDSSLSQYLISVTSFTPPEEATVCFWLYINSVGTIQRVVRSGGNWEVALTNSGYVSGDLRQGTGTVLSTFPLAIYTLYHIACTVDNSANAQIYIDGVLNQDNDESDGEILTETLRIGAKDSSPQQYLNGHIGDVRIYDRVLSANEIMTVYSCKGNDGIVHGLLHRWLLNEGAPGTSPSGSGSVKDTGPAQLNMTPNNSPVYTGTDLKYKRFY